MRISQVPIELGKLMIRVQGLLLVSQYEDNKKKEPIIHRSLFLFRVFSETTEPNNHRTLDDLNISQGIWRCQEGNLFGSEVRCAAA